MHSVVRAHCAVGTVISRAQRGFVFFGMGQAVPARIGRHGGRPSSEALLRRHRRFGLMAVSELQRVGGMEDIGRLMRWLSRL